MRIKRIMAAVLAGSMLIGIGSTAAVVQAAEQDEDVCIMTADVETPFFSDVVESDWFYSSVRLMQRLYYMTGLTEDVFGPHQSLSRAQFAVILYRMAGYPSVTGTSPFSDVQDEKSWYYDAVVWAAQNGAVTGYADGRFGPADPITREQAVTMLCRIIECKNEASGISEDTDVIGRFQDRENISFWAEEAINWAVGAGVLQGKNNGETIEPQSSISRAETAAVIDRLLSSDYRIAVSEADYEKSKIDINGFTAFVTDRRDGFIPDEAGFIIVSSLEEARQRILTAGGSLYETVSRMYTENWFSDHKLVAVKMNLSTLGSTIDLRDIRIENNHVYVDYEIQKGGGGMGACMIRTLFILIEVDRDVDITEATCTNIR